MSHKKALYAGSFDPFTMGHFDIVKRGLGIFDEIIIVVAVSPSKSSFLERTVRKELIEKIYKDEKRIKVAVWEGLIVDYAKEQGVSSVIRGLRPTGDFEIEFQMASMNRKLYAGIETVFLMTGENLYFISSSLVREVCRYGGDIKQFVPEDIYQYLKNNKGAK